MFEYKKYNPAPVPRGCCGREFFRGIAAIGLSVLFILVAIPARSADTLSAPVCPDCNIILVSLDTLRQDALGTYGYTRATSPNLDRLALKGTVFLNAWSQAPNTYPSHMSIFTSLYPWTHKARQVFDKLQPDIVTLPMALQAQGYHTLWSAPIYDDLFLGIRTGMERGYDAFVPSVPEITYGESDIKLEWQLAFNWLGKHRDRKSFIFLHTYHAHEPYSRNNRFPLAADISVSSNTAQLMSWLLNHASQNEQLDAFRQELLAKPEILSLSDPWARRIALMDTIKKTVPQSRWWGFRPPVLYKLAQDSPGEVLSLRSAYDAGVFELDMLVNSLFKKLEEFGLKEKTLVVITSDHGEEFLEHGQLWHNQLYTENIRIPLIFIFPGQQQGKRLARPVQSIDIAPTILEAVGLAALPAAEGISLLPLIQGRALYTPKSDALTFAEWGIKYSVRDGRYTYIVENKCGDRFANWDKACLTEEFYDRKADPGELKNIFSAKQKAAAGLAALLSDKIKPSVKKIPYTWAQGLSEDNQKRMRETGYW